MNIFFHPAKETDRLCVDETFFKVLKSPPRNFADWKSSLIHRINAVLNQRYSLNSKNNLVYVLHDIYLKESINITVDIVLLNDDLLITLLDFLYSYSPRYCIALFVDCRSIGVSNGGMVHINLKCVAVEEEIREVFNSRISFDKLNAGKRNKLDTPFWCPETLFRKASEFEDLKGVIVWSPNGKSMLTYDNILPIFNILNIECRTFDEISFGGIKKIGGLSFNREGTLLAWATLDNRLFVFDIGSRLLIANMELKGVRFLNWIDSKQLLIVFTRNGAIRVDITNNIASTLLDTPILSADFSSTLSLIASSRESDYSISLTKLNTLTKVSLEGHTEGVKTLKWSPNGDLLLSYSWDNTIKIWDGKTNVLIQTLTFQCRITSTSWSHDQKYVATADSTRRIAIWDIRTGECIASAYGTFALWSPAESVIATRNLAEKTLCCWSLL